MTNALRVAVLGAGFMGGTHARSWATLSEVEIAAIYAHSADRALPLADELGTRWTDDLDALLGDETIHAVDICLPTPEHRAALEAVLGAGKHALLEKPLALTAEDAAAMVTLVDRSEPIVMVAHVLRFWPQYVELKRIVDSGELGRPLSGNATRRQPFPAWSKLFAQADLTGGAILDMMIHDYDALNWVLGTPRTVTAHGLYNERSGGRDQAQVLIGYDGATGVVDGGMMMPESYPFTSKLEILCERGAVEHHFRAGGRSFEVGESMNTLTVYRPDGDPEIVDVAQTDGYDNEIAYFAECVRRGTPAERASVRDAELALAVALAASASAAHGGTVTVAN